MSSCKQVQSAGAGPADRVSITTRIDAKIRAACARIAEGRWIDIRYPEAIWDVDEHRWISDAQIAETSCTAFDGTRHDHRPAHRAPGETQHRGHAIIEQLNARG